MVGKMVDLFSATIPIFITGGKYNYEIGQSFSGPQYCFFVTEWTVEF
jgi:hypothetical protein